MGRNPEPSRRIPSFFKVMIGDFSQQLLIPPAFAKHFDGVVPQKVLLRSHEGRASHVNVEKVGNNLSFGKGWSLFLKDNFLEFGDFLVFQYVENSEFNVIIYGKNCCEKEVALATRKTNDVIYIDSDCSSDETGMPSPQDQCESKEIQPLQDYSKRLTREKRAATGSQVRLITPEPSSSRVPMATHGKTRALEAARKFVSKHPFFKVVIMKSHLRYGNLSVPRSFVEKYIKEVSQSLTLGVSNGSCTWPVKLLIEARSHRGRFRAGSRAFVRDNNLAEGDVCIFELIKRNDMILKVSIFRCIE